MSEYRHGYPAEVFEAVQEKYTPIPTKELYTNVHPYIRTGYSEVYRANSKKDDHLVALKFVRDEGGVTDRSARTLQELDIVAEKILSVESPFILQPEHIVYDDEHGIGIATPWAEFGELGSEGEIHYFPANGEIIASFGMQLALGLHELHKKEIVHRDLKPNNIFVNAQDKKRKFKRYQIGDFGLSALQSYLDKEKVRVGFDDPINIHTDLDVWGERYTPKQAVIGTPMYMSPEQARDQHLTPKSDLFVLGILLYEAITRDYAFNGDNANQSMIHIVFDPPVNRDIFTNVNLHHMTHARTERLKDIIEALLVKDVEQRGILSDGTKVETAADVAKELAKLWNGNTSAQITKTQEFQMAKNLQ